jgi:hypothetical protein
MGEVISNVIMQGIIILQGQLKLKLERPRVYLQYRIVQGIRVCANSLVFVAGCTYVEEGY